MRTTSKILTANTTNTVLQNFNGEETKHKWHGKREHQNLELFVQAEKNLTNVLSVVLPRSVSKLGFKFQIP